MVTDRLGLHLEDSASSEEIYSVGVVGEVTPEPDAGRQHEGSEVQEEGVPIPEKVEGVESVVEDGQRDE